MKKIESRIKKTARAMGFDAVGIASADPFALAGKVLEQRIAGGSLRGYGFSQAAIADWTTPELALPGARSIVAVALAYSFDSQESTRSGLQGQVARFARGRDYHHIVQGKLHQLIDTVSDEIHTPVNARICCDGGPLLDRPAALRAGIGWQGCNSCVYVRDLGSWVVLGEVVMNMELEPDAPMEGNRCGGCNRCVESCPTGALSSRYTVCVSRCISHLTQMTGAIPRELRSSIGTRIYGCDVCQEVCPHNRSARPGNHPELDPADGPGSQIDLVELLSSCQADFRNWFDKTALGWIGKRRLLRNAIVVLGNYRNPDALPLLERYARGPDALLREHAQWALEQIITG